MPRSIRGFPFASTISDPEVWTNFCWAKREVAESSKAARMARDERGLNMGIKYRAWNRSGCGRKSYKIRYLALGWHSCEGAETTFATLCQSQGIEHEASNSEMAAEAAGV